MNPYEPPIEPPLQPVTRDADGEGETISLGGIGFTVTARSIPRYLYTTVDIRVLIGDRTVLSTGGVLSPISSKHSDFVHEGKPHHLELKWGLAMAFTFPVTLVLDGTASREFPVRPSNWYVALLAIVVFIGAPLYLVMRILLHR